MVGAAPAVSREPPSAAPLVADLARPPDAVLRALYELAQIGDILELRTQLTALMHADARWQPFLDPLLHFAQKFQLVEIRAQLEAVLS